MHLPIKENHPITAINNKPIRITVISNTNNRLSILDPIGVLKSSDSLELARPEVCVKLMLSLGMDISSLVDSVADGATFVDLRVSWYQF